MNRSELEHVIRAAADVCDGDEIVIVGSQAILGEHPDAPRELLRSMEANVYPRGRPELAAAIDGAIGDGSMFHDTYGYYAHGVGPDTATVPDGWQDRLVRVDVDLGHDRIATGWCLEAHDLVLSKCVAGRPHDRAYAQAAIQAGIVGVDELLRRVARLPVAPDEHDRVERMIAGWR